MGIQLSGTVTAYHVWEPAFGSQQLTHRHISLPIPYKYQDKFCWKQNLPLWASTNSAGYQSFFIHSSTEMLKTVRGFNWKTGPLLSAGESVSRGSQIISSGDFLTFFSFPGGWNLHSQAYWLAHRMFAEFWNWLDTRCWRVNNAFLCLDGHVTNIYNSHENVIIHRCQQFTSLLPVFKKEKVDKCSWKGLAENGLRSASVSRSSWHLVHTSPGIHLPPVPRLHVAFPGHRCSWNTGPASVRLHCLWASAQTQ